MSTTTTYTLWEVTPDEAPLGGPSYNANGDLMVFPTYEDAAAMARWMVEDPAQFPLVGINADRTTCDDDTCTAAVYDVGTDSYVCPTHGTDCENEAWSVGWAHRHQDGTVTVHEGDYENDPDWDALLATWASEGVQA